MPIEKSAGAIIFRKKNNKPLFLLLHYPSITHRSDKEYWDLPKGHIEKGETEARAMRREVSEETGIKDLKLVSKFRETVKYFFRWKGKTIFKIVVFYLGETENKEIKISGEHMGYKWLPYEEVIKQATFKNAKNILQKANDFLSEKGV